MNFILLFCGLIYAAQLDAQQSWEIGSPVLSDVVATLSADETTLTISGTGEMMDFFMYWDGVNPLNTWSTAPWNEYISNINTVVIEHGVTRISLNAFRKYPELISVTIANSVTTIDHNAFMESTALTEVFLPNSITYIGSYVFDGCTSLTAINVATDNEIFSSEDGVLFNKDKTTLILFPTGRHGIYTIPNTVNIINDSAFSGCTGLNEVVIPNSVTSLGGFSFAGCNGLNSIYIQNMEPPVVNWYAFNGVDLENCTLYVPHGRVATYRVANVWMDFVNIKSLPGTDNDLFSLSASHGTLTPAFSPTTLFYFLSLPDDISTFNIIATASDDDAEVTGAGEYTVATELKTIVVEVTAVDGTKKNYTINVSVQQSGGSTTSTEELFALTLSVYPNPFSDAVRISGVADITNPERATILQVINSAGAIVHTQPIVNNDETINLEHLPVGVYFLRFENKGDVKILRIVKE